MGGKGGTVGKGDNGGKVGGAGGVRAGGSGGSVGKGDNGGNEGPGGNDGDGVGVCANKAVARAATTNTMAPASLIFISVDFEYLSATSRDVLRLPIELQATVARRVDEGA